jgi:hypothetical protein
VAWAAPAFPCTIIRGEWDYLSALFFPRADVILPGVGHLGYLRHQKVRELVNAHLGAGRHAEPCGNT